MSTCNIDGCTMPNHNHGHERFIRMTTPPKAATNGMATKDDVKPIEVEIKNFEPQYITVDHPTKYLFKGTHCTAELILTKGNHVVNELKKTLFVSKSGKYVKHDKVWMIWSEQTTGV